MKEKSVVRSIQLGVKRAYPKSWIIKIADRFTRFLPDLIVQVLLHCGLGVTLYIETKTVAGVLSKGQEAEHEKIRSQGGVVIVARYAADVLRFYERWKEYTGR